MTEADIHEMGVKNSAHRALIASSLVVLRRKTNQSKPLNQSCLYIRNSWENLIVYL